MKNIVLVRYLQLFRGWKSYSQYTDVANSTIIALCPILVVIKRFKDKAIDVKVRHLQESYYIRKFSVGF